MAADPTTVLLEAVRAYLAATHPRFPLDRVKLVGRDKNKIVLRVAFDLTPPVGTPSGVEEEPAEPYAPFIPNPFQQAILAALDGKARRTDALGAAVGDRSRLFRDPGGLKELRERGLVDHHERVGFFRPDAPPESMA